MDEYNQFTKNIKVDLGKKIFIGFIFMDSQKNNNKIIWAFF